jgi:GNAT superfamily N-acetyltransferase
MSSERDAILVDPAPTELAAAVEENLFALFRAMMALPGAELEETARLSRHIASPFNPMFKGAWGAALAPDEVDGAIDETIAWFRARQAPFCFWWTSDRAAPANLGERLVAHGFAAWETDAPGMVAGLDDLRYDLLDRTPPGFTIERVADAAGLARFERAFAEGLEVPAWAARAWVDATLALGIGRTPWTMYVGLLDGEPVASNMLFNGAGVASVYGVATVPAARRRGIGAAITLIAYQEARALGYRHGVLFATDLGAPVYRRIGFRDADFRMGRYLWRAE